MVKLSLNVPNDYNLTDGEVDNIVYLTCKYTVGWPMRQADKMVCQQMMDQTARGQKQVESLLQVTCDYVWDHICGEPDDFSPEDIKSHMVPLLNEWFSNTNQEERSKTELDGS